MSGKNSNRPPAGGLKALFTKEIDEALLDERIDLAVHSLKDLAGDLPSGIVIGAVPEREDPRDAWISKTKHRLNNCPRARGSGPAPSAAKPSSSTRAQTSRSSPFAETSIRACENWPKGTWMASFWRWPASNAWAAPLKPQNLSRGIFFSLPPRL